MSESDGGGGNGQFKTLRSGRVVKLHIPGSLDGFASSSPPTEDPKVDRWTTMTIAEARAAGLTCTTRCLDGWLISEQDESGP